MRRKIFGEGNFFMEKRNICRMKIFGLAKEKEKEKLLRNGGLVEGRKEGRGIEESSFKRSSRTWKKSCKYVGGSLWS